MNPKTSAGPMAWVSSSRVLRTKNIGRGARRRRRDKLRSAFALHKAMTGEELNLTHLADRLDCTAGALSQLLTGRMLVNTEWMLIFARLLGRAPQEIFTEDWPYPELTVHPAFGRLMLQWSQLTPQLQTEILKLLDGELLPRGRPPGK